jgi:outer membrane protein OmpA-like peptidoglycan-associated protein
MRQLLVLFIFLIGLAVGSISAQPVSTTSGRAEKFYREARRLVALLKPREAIPLFEKAIEIDQQFIEAYLSLAEAYYNLGEIEASLKQYEKGLTIDPTFYPLGFYNLGVLKFENGRYESALRSFTNYQEYGDRPLHNKDQLEYYKACCQFSIKSVNNPVPFKPTGLGDGVNSAYSEYWPTLSADEKMLVFTVLLPIDKTNPNTFHNQQEDFYVSYYQNGQWTKAKSLGEPLNTDDNEGAQTISADGRLMVYTSCNDPEGEGRCDLYLSEREGGQWLPPKNMREPVNTAAKETQPSLNYNGKALYFASDRPGGKGKLDIWVSYRKPNGNWDDPVNLGDSINTPGDEMSPFIHYDNNTLYFAGDRHVGLGGFDIYRSKRIQDETWSKPENLGYPINTHNDEIGLIVNTMGNRAYYSTNRVEGRGKDIFSFEMPEPLRPEAVSYFKGYVYDKDTRKPLGAQFEMINLNNGEMVNEAHADIETGQFLLSLPPRIEYMINVSHPGYLFFSEHIEMKTHYEKDSPYLMDIPLQPIKEGVNIVLRNIFYETDEYALKEQSKFELNKLITFLQDNPNVHVEIEGHTDNVGTAEYNIQLSENRAETVAGYLVEKGVEEDRITSKGYGQDDPIASNKTSEGRAKNRRTEMRIVKITD